MKSLTRMVKMLSKQEMKMAEKALRQHFPRSHEAYGQLFMLNRVELEPGDVVVDRWPDFRVLLVKTRQQQKTDVLNNVSVFAKDKSRLWDILTKTDVLDWKQKITFGVDLQHADLFKAVAVNRGVPMTTVAVGYVMELKDPSKLINERSSIQASSVQESHAALINSKWKFANGEATLPLIRSMIRKLPSSCVLDTEGRPVSWVLTCGSGEIGVAYTLPELRGKGLCKAVTVDLAKKMLSEGYSVYCFTEEGNTPPYRLLTSIGFANDPSYRNAWFNFNFL